MLLNTSDLLINESDLLKRESIIDSEPLNENFSFFRYGLECMEESNREIRSLMVNLYTSTGYTNESVSEDVMEEFSKQFSFGKIFNFIIEKFKEGIKKLVVKAKVFFLKILAANSTIKKYGDDIKKYNKSIKVDFDYYKYTYLDVDIPSAKANTQFSEEYETLLDDLKELAHNTTKEELLQKLDIYCQELSASLNDNYYNHIRALTVLDDDGVVTKDKYIGRLWSFFRNNENKAYAKKIEVPPYDIHDMYERFSEGRKLVKEVERSRAKIEASCESTKREVNKISPLDFMSKGSYIPIDYDIEFAVDRILKVKCGQLVEMCNIFTTAYSLKLDAIKEALVQDKKILFAVVRDIMISSVSAKEVDSDDE